jgi:large subunit ribosomal protein L25
MAETDLHVEKREQTRHGTSKKLRQEGKVPGIFYAQNEDAVPVSMNQIEIQYLAHSDIYVFNVIFPDGTIRKSILREVQTNPVDNSLVHVDLFGVKLTQKVRLSIPVLFIGVPIGVKEGGILEHLIREVEVEGLPLEIPEHIEVDVSHLNIGDGIVLKDILIEKIKFITDENHPVANVIHPKVVQEVVPEEEQIEEGEAAAGAEEKEKTETQGKE